jgi:hypothetical protein
MQVQSQGTVVQFLLSLLRQDFEAFMTVGKKNKNGKAVTMHATQA